MVIHSSPSRASSPRPMPSSSAQEESHSIFSGFYDSFKDLVGQTLAGSGSRIASPNNCSAPLRLNSKNQLERPRKPGIAAQVQFFERSLGRLKDTRKEIESSYSSSRRTKLDLIALHRWLVDNTPEPVYPVHPVHKTPGDFADEWSTKAAENQSRECFQKACEAFVESLRERVESSREIYASKAISLEAFDRFKRSLGIFLDEGSSIASHKFSDLLLLPHFREGIVERIDQQRVEIVALLQDENKKVSRHYADTLSSQMLLIAEETYTPSDENRRHLEAAAKLLDDTLESSNLLISDAEQIRNLRQGLLQHAFNTQKDFYYER